MKVIFFKSISGRFEPATTEKERKKEREREKGIDRGNRLKDRKSMFVGTWGL